LREKDGVEGQHPDSRIKTVAGALRWIRRRDGPEVLLFAMAPAMT
jgi:hypothetical protein